MHRTTILLPNPLRLKLAKEAEREHVSLGELIRRALEKYIVSKRSITAHDSFLSSQTVFDDEGPSNVADRHDEHLYKQDPH